MSRQATAGAMPAASTTPADAAHARKALLQEIRVKWGRFSEQEVVAKYGLAKDAAQCDADAMRKGRDIRARRASQRCEGARGWPHAGTRPATPGPG